MKLTYVLVFIFVQDIGHLKNLSELDMSENRLEWLPREIGLLVNITDVHLSQNLLEYLPDEIGTIFSRSLLYIYQIYLCQVLGLFV